MKVFENSCMQFNLFQNISKFKHHAITFHKTSLQHVYETFQNLCETCDSAQTFIQYAPPEVSDADLRAFSTNIQTKKQNAVFFNKKLKKFLINKI